MRVGTTVHGAYGGTRGHVWSYASPFPVVVPTQNVVNSRHRSKFTLDINFWTFFTTVGFPVFSSKISFF